MADLQAEMITTLRSPFQYIRSEHIAGGKIPPSRLDVGRVSRIIVQSRERHGSVSRPWMQAPKVAASGRRRRLLLGQ